MKVKYIMFSFKKNCPKFKTLSDNKYRYSLFLKNLIYRINCTLKKIGTNNYVFIYNFHFPVNKKTNHHLQLVIGVVSYYQISNLEFITVYTKNQLVF